VSDPEQPVLLEPQVHGDARGFFLETYRAEALAARGIDHVWVQDNHSRSARGVLRGLHFSVDPGQAKLVRCARGSIRDGIVDLRAGSPAFGRPAMFDLDDVRHRQLYVPIGFAHGFVVTSDVADVVYKCSDYYDPARERALAFDDPAVGVEWGVVEPLVSDRDRAAPRLAEIADSLPFRYLA
jgi:dTDP-4-dehydrorhamnose 3,5-epimerase